MSLKRQLKAHDEFDYKMVTHLFVPKYVVWIVLASSVVAGVLWGFDPPFIHFKWHTVFKNK